MFATLKQSLIDLWRGSKKCYRCHKKPKRHNHILEGTIACSHCHSILCMECFTEMTEQQQENGCYSQLRCLQCTRMYCWPFLFLNGMQGASSRVEWLTKKIWNRQWMVATRVISMHFCLPTYPEDEEMCRQLCRLRTEDGKFRGLQRLPIRAVQKGAFSAQHCRRRAGVRYGEWPGCRASLDVQISECLSRSLMEELCEGIWYGCLENQVLFGVHTSITQLCRVPRQVGNSLS